MASKKTSKDEELSTLLKEVRAMRRDLNTIKQIKPARGKPKGKMIYSVAARAEEKLAPGYHVAVKSSDLFSPGYEVLVKPSVVFPPDYAVLVKSDIAFPPEYEVMAQPGNKIDLVINPAKTRTVKGR
jgi:hypothetical protein